MTALHIYRLPKPGAGRGYPLCGQANSYGGVYLNPGDAVPGTDHATCKRCIKRQAATR